MHLETLAKVKRQSDRQVATEMLAELLQPVEHLQRSRLALMQQFVGEQFKAE